MTTFRVGLSLVLTAFIGITSCASAPDSDSVELANAVALSDLIGEWETEPTLGQFGVAIVGYSFRADGTFSTAMDLQSMPSVGSLAVSGSYKLTDKQLLLTTANKSTTATVQFEDEVLLLTDEDGEQFRLRRK